MPLFVTDNDTVDVKVVYTESGGDLEFYEEKFPDGSKAETFTFRRPNWQDQRTIMEGALAIDATGMPVVDPYKFMDSKFKTLLCKWTLKDEDGDIPVTSENIDRLHPSLIEYLSSKADRLLGLADDDNAVLNQKTAPLPQEEKDKGIPEGRPELSPTQSGTEA